MTTDHLRTLNNLRQVPRPTTITRSARPAVRAAIAGVGSWLPDHVVTSEEVERRITEASRVHGFVPPPGVVTERSGVRERRYKLPHEDASDMAVHAAGRALAQAGTSVGDIDLIIFASSSQDLVEPATAHLVSHKLGADGAMVFDVKNACNSFMTGMQVADGLIRTGQYEKVLVCTGEAPSEAIRWELKDSEQMKTSFAGYTFGDAGAAMVLEARSDGTGIRYLDFRTASRHWEICTLRGGGTMHPRDLEHTYFAGDGNSLRDAFIELGPQILVDCFERTKTSFSDYDIVIFHQVTGPFLDTFLAITEVPESKVVRTVDTLGNIASATMPLQLERAINDGRAKRGSNVLWIGLGAGISVGVMVTRL
ncbi:MAG: ketoacyl-ACP synthase III [Mycolicibacterium cosmeticum]|nr:ketoacyl-ACP synthase III [Mycolicibacterium cosmeticum]